MFPFCWYVKIRVVQLLFHPIQNLARFGDVENAFVLAALPFVNVDAGRVEITQVQAGAGWRGPAMALPTDHN